MKADYVHKDTLTATDYVELNKNNELLVSYNQTLLKEIQELKKQLEEYKATNKILSHELTKDKILKQDHLTTCCGIPIADIPKLIEKNKKLEVLVECLKLGVTLNQEQEELLDKILLGGDNNE